MNFNKFISQILKYIHFTYKEPPKNKVNSRTCANENGKWHDIYSIELCNLDFKIH